jgi:hypothetical protein
MATKEILSTDLMPAPGEYQDTVSWNELRLGMGAVEPVTEKGLLDGIDVEKFMADELVIVIHKSTDKNALERVPVGVNGEQAWLPRDTKIKIPRRFVERLARAQEATFRTDDNPDPRMDEGKIIRRTNGQVFPFQVIYDPSPRGRAWLAKVTREG